MTERDGRIVGISFGYTNFISGEHEFKPWYNELGFAHTYTKENFTSFSELVNAVKLNAPNNIHLTIIKIPKYPTSQIMREINKLADVCQYGIVDTPFDEDKAYREFRLIKSTPSASTVKKLSNQKTLPKLSKAKISKLINGGR